MAGERHIGEDFAGQDFSRCDLSGADLSRCNLSGCRLIGARMVGTILFGANLDGAELLGADLTDADLSECSAVKAGFGHAKLVGAKLFEAQLAHATFTGADLTGADLRSANLHGCSMRETILVSCDARAARMTEADITQATMDHGNFDGVDLRQARMAHLSGYTSASWIGTDIRQIDFCGAHLVRSHIMDENYLHEFRHQSRANERVYRIWSLTSDCGRSFSRWGLCTLIIAVVFCGIFTQVAIDYGEHQTWLSPLYYSIVTLTTLGYGDVLPMSTWAQAASMVEVVIGYVMLGGALSIFTTKMARRAS